MPRYRYKARTMEGKAVEAILEAPNETALQRDLSAKGLLLIDWSIGQRAAPVSATGGPRFTPRDLMLFTMEIGMSYSAGLPLVATLDDMAESAESQAIRVVVAGISDRVKGGQTLANALAAFPRAFPSLYVELVSGAEKTGKLDVIMEDLAKFLEWQKQVRGQIVSATVYPASLLGAVVGLTVILIFFVFPKFLGTFASMGDALPMPTKILLILDTTMKANWQFVVGVLVGLPAVFLAVRNRPTVRWRLDTMKLRLPAMGPLVIKIAMSRFSHNMAMMLGSGLEFGQCLRSCERMMGNVVLANLVAEARQSVEQGQPFSDAMAKGKFVPSLVRRMIKLGETTGKMEETLQHVSDFYDKEVPEAIKKMFSLFEPAILVFMAGVVLFMAAAVFLPLYGMMDVASKQ